jgi:hypothetical protein
VADNQMLSAMHDAYTALSEGKINGGLDDLMAVAMRATYQHEICTNEEQRLRAALSAVITYKGFDSDEARRIVQEVRWLGRISDILIAASDSLLAILPPPTEFDQPIILPAWKKVKQEQ